MLAQAIEAQILLLIPLILFFPTILLLIHFVRQAIIQKKKIFYYLSALFLIYLATHFFEGAQALATTQLEGEFDFIMAQIFRMLMLYVLVIILEFYSQNILFSGKQTLLAILAFFAIGGMVSGPELEATLIESRYIISFEHLSPIILVQIIFNLYATIWVIIMLRRNMKSAHTSKQRKILRILFISLLLAILLPVFPNLIESIFGRLRVRSVYQDIIFSSMIQGSGILIIGILFYRISNNPWLLQQQEVYLLIIYSHDGLELYSKSFSRNISSESLILLAGGFSAISSMFQEITDAEGIIKAILLEDKELRIIKKEHFISALLVDYSTEATEEAHKSFADEFESRFRSELRQFAGEVSVFTKVDEIINNYFY